MTANADLKARTKSFALRIIKVVDALPNTRSANVIGDQLLRSGTSVGANYRAACRGRSTAEFVAKLGIVEEEADECGYWLELLVDSGLMSAQQLSELMRKPTNWWQSQWRRAKPRASEDNLECGRRISEC